MPEVQGIAKIFSYGAGKRLGKHREWGRAMFGFSDYGEGDLDLILTPYGISSFGEINFGDHLIMSGIFFRNNATGKVKYFRRDYYIPSSPQSVPQQSNRAKMTAGVLAWQALTTEQQSVYNKSAIGKRMSGYNLFLKQYLLSN